MTTRATRGNVIAGAAGRSHKPPKTAMLLAQRIVDDITTGGHRPGDILLPEREMLTHYEVGRGTLREALRFLEMQGVLHIKPGPGGGPVITPADSRHLASTIALLLHMQGTPFRSIVEVRELIEPPIAALAAERMTPEILEAIRESVQLMRDGIGDQRKFLDENARFHDLIAEASGNTLLHYFLTSLHWITDGRAMGVDYSSKVDQAVVCRAHERILAALEARDPDAAREAMRKHISQFAGFLQHGYSHLMDTPINWSGVVA